MKLPFRFPQDKKLRIALVAGLALTVAAGAVFTVTALRSARHAAGATYYCPMHPAYTSEQAGLCPICNMSLVKREPLAEVHEGGHGVDGKSTKTEPAREFTIEELVNMKPGEICLLHKCEMGTCMVKMTEETARAGVCPHCGEDLNVIIKEAVPEGYAAVKMGYEKREMIGVKTAPVQKVNLDKTLRTAGRIAYDAELYQAQEEYLQAIKAAKKAAGTDEIIRVQAEKLVESARIKLRLLGLGDALIEELEKSGQADRTLLYSEAGSTVWLYAPIYEYEIPLVSVGNTIQAEIPALPGTVFQGTIRAIDPVLDPVTRSARVRAILDNHEGRLKPEMYVNATLHIESGEKLAVPNEAVFATGEKNIVFVSQPDGLLEPREVLTGVRTDRFTEIRSGLSAGEMVVTSGNFLIDSESRLKAALEGIGGGTHQHGG